MESSMKTIAVVDDEKEILDVFKRFLSKDNLYQVQTYSDPALALSSIQSSEVDLILLDIMMPGVNGIEFLEKIKSAKPDIKVIMVTAYATLERLLKSHKFDAYDFVEKPVNLHELLNKVEKALA